MMEEIEWSDIDRSSPIWSGSGCDYFSLSAEVNSYYTLFFKDVRKDRNNAFNQTNEERVSGATFMKTEEYFRVLWRDVSEVGFERDDSDQCIDTCKTLIREEVDWWGERTDLKEYGALKVPSLVEYHSWDMIWRLCKYHKLVAHKLHNYASKKQSVLKKDLPQSRAKKSIPLNLQTIQFAELCEGFKRIGAIDKETSLSVFKSYLDGSEFNTVITPIKFKNSTYVAVFIYLCEEYGLQAEKEYFKWREFFGISMTYANKQLSAYRTGELSLPPYYQQMDSILKEIGFSKPDYKKR